MKRLISLLIGFSLIASLLVACGTAEETESGSSPSEEVHETIVEESVSPEPEVSDEEIEETVEVEIEEEKEEIPEFLNRNLKLATKYKIDGTPDSEIYYYEDGQVWQEDEYSSDGNTIYETLYEYNEFGLTKIVKRTVNVQKETATETAREEYNYDNNGNLIQEIIWATKGQEDYNIDTVTEHDYNSNNEIVASYDLSRQRYGYPDSVDYFARKKDAYETFTYDDNGNLISSTWYSSNLTNYTYDDKGNLITEKIYTGEELSLSETKEYSYNKDGLLETITVYDGVGEVEQTTTYEYDENQNVLNEETINPDDIIIESLYLTYWDNGNIKTERGVNREDGISSTFDRTYWSNGNLKTDSDFNDYDYCGNITYDIATNEEHEYTYDEYGNIITETVIGNGTTTEYTYVNEYYD